MKKFIYSFLFIALFIPSTSFAFSGGSGTEGDPWQIATPADLAEVNDYIGLLNSDKYFVVTANIDLDTAPYNSGSGWTPIGNSTNKFTGNFDGASYTISNLYISTTTNYSGLFGYIDDGSVSSTILSNPQVSGNTYVAAFAGFAKGTLTDIQVISGNVTTTGGLAGGIIGRSSALTLTNATTSVTVVNAAATSPDSVGGAVGYTTNNSVLTNIYATGNVSGDNNVGGLVGYHSDGSIVTSSYATGDISGSNDSGGGLVGLHSGTGTTISNSYATGSVTLSGSASRGGGLVGRALTNASIVRSFASGTISCGGNFCGGLVGELDGATIANSYAKGDVSGSAYVGGLVGYTASGATITNSYSVGAPSGSNAGGLVGDGTGTASNSFWDVDTSGTGTSDVGTGTTTAAMKTQSTFTDASWDFTNTWNIAGAINDGYPYLRWEISDVTDPTVSTFSPVDGATGVATNSNLVITFDENIVTSTGFIYLKLSSDDSTVESFNVASSTITASGTTALIINPTSDLDELTSYYVAVDATAVDDSSGNSFAGIASSTTWNFTTADETNPTIATLSPADDATNVAINSNLVITFTETVSAQSGDITIYKASDDSTVETFDVTADISGSGTTAITINPTSNFNYETAYYVFVDATAFDDASSNSFAGIAASTTWSFTTAAMPESSGGDVGGGNRYNEANPLTREIIDSWDAEEKTEEAQDEETGSATEERGPVILIDKDQGLQCSSVVYVTNPIRFGAANNPADVRLLEEYLNTYENAGLEVNGVYDKVDFDAVVVWQEKYAAEILAPWGISQGTGYVYTTSLAKIKSIHEANCATAAPVPAQEVTNVPVKAQCLVTAETLEFGLNNSDVAIAQQLLKNLGYFPEDVSATGYFGLITQTAVTTFQAENGIEQAGVIGPKTRAKLNELGC